MQESRLFRIIYYLMEHGKTTAPKLAKKFEVSVRTIYRDVDVLSGAGVPIYVTTGRNGGIQIDDDFIIDKLILSDEEKEEVLTALKSVSIVDDSSDTLSKLTALFNTKSENWLEVDFSRWGNNSQDNEMFQLLKKAILSHKMISISYANSNGEITKRIICPLQLLFKSKSWYVKAYCMAKSDFRLFKMTRIVQVEKLDMTFNNMEFPQEEHTNLNVNEELVKLSFPKTMAYRVYDDFEINQISKDDNGDFIVAAPMPLDNWLVGYLLSFGSNVNVIEPTYLKEVIYNEAKKICEINKP